jgi:hypothetical protein
MKMNPIGLWLKVAIVSTVVFSAGIEELATGIASSSGSQKPVSCIEDAYRQFDFWVGDWDAFDVDRPSTKVARARVDLILDGCVLREEYEGTNGTKGQSFSIYNAPRGVWHQSWVTNRGQLLVIEGTFQAGEMVLSGVNHGADNHTRVRGTWTPVDGGVRETAVTSTDGGKTWKPWFDLLFRPHKP